MIHCRRFRSPDDVAVIGVDNDEFICELSNPPLSSIATNTERISYEAAALLARMMKGEPPPSEPILLPHLGVVPRQSTDVLATDDRELAQAIRYIRAHACQGLRVDQLLRVTRLSHVSLIRGMRNLLGRTPKEEITHVKIETAKRLLCQTDMTVATIARRCGFSEPKYFNDVFRAKAGMTPGTFRQNKNAPKSVEQSH